MISAKRPVFRVIPHAHYTQYNLGGSNLTDVVNPQKSRFSHSLSLSRIGQLWLSHHCRCGNLVQQIPSPLLSLSLSSLCLLSLPLPCTRQTNSLLFVELHNFE